MNIFVLVKHKSVFLHQSRNITDYLSKDDFFRCVIDSFKNLNHSVSVSWEESVLFSAKFCKVFPFLYRLIFYAIRKLGLRFIDVYLTSKRIALYCKQNNINLIFTEINSSFSPKLVKKWCPNVCITEWFGIEPINCDEFTQKCFLEYDYIWSGGKLSPVNGNEKFADRFNDVGPIVNDDVFYHEYDNNFAFDLVFIGGISSMHKNRIEVLESIAASFDNFAWFGYGIELLDTNSPLRKCFKGWAYPDVIRKSFSSSKIALNLTLDNYSNWLTGFNERLFQIPFCNGAIQVVRDDPKIKSFFTPGEDLLTFKSVDDLISLLNKVLGNIGAYSALVERSNIKVQNYKPINAVRKMLEIVENGKV